MTDYTNASAIPPVVGKRHIRRDGKITVPAEHDGGEDAYPFNCPPEDGYEHWYREDGRSCVGRSADIVAIFDGEAANSPVDGDEVVSEMKDIGNSSNYTNEDIRPVIYSDGDVGRPLHILRGDIDNNGPCSPFTHSGIHGGVGDRQGFSSEVSVLFGVQFDAGGYTGNSDPQKKDDYSGKAEKEVSQTAEHAKLGRGRACGTCPRDGEGHQGGDQPLTESKATGGVAQVQMSKYHKIIKGVSADVYDVLVAFDVTCPATAHAIKKLLAAGSRGHKDRITDLREAGQSIARAVEMEEGK